jgi:mRNA-degrading endonuclease toxin of MazEF toxin-antitoxin module
MKLRPWSIHKSRAPVSGIPLHTCRRGDIIQDDVANEYSPVVIVAAVTTALGPKEYPTEVRARPAGRPLAWQRSGGRRMEGLTQVVTPAAMSM